MAEMRRKYDGKGTRRPNGEISRQLTEADLRIEEPSELDPAEVVFNPFAQLTHFGRHGGLSMLRVSDTRERRRRHAQR